jgi:general secretion pathway protein K
MHCRRCSFNASVRAPAQQRGAALIVAMLVFALATALVVAMKGDFERFFQRTSNQLLDEQVQAYLRGAEDLAAMALIADYDQDKEQGLQRDDLSESWSPKPGSKPPTYPLDNIGWMTGTLVDLQGRFNLNRLATREQQGGGGVPTARFTPAQQQFIRLLQAVGEPEVSEQEAIMITESVSDWLDTDASPSQDGAEDEYYSSRTPSYRTANRAMASVSELRAVAHMTPGLYQALQPFVSVWPSEPAPLNIHTAPPTVLRSINADGDLSPLSEMEAAALVEYRGDAAGESHFQDLNNFLENEVFKGKQMAKIRPLLGKDSSYFLLQAEAEVAGRNMRLYSVLQRGNRRIDAIARASGSL